MEHPCKSCHVALEAIGLEAVTSAVTGPAVLAQSRLAHWLGGCEQVSYSISLFVASCYDIIYSHSFQFSPVMLCSLVEVAAGGAG